MGWFDRRDGERVRDVAPYRRMMPYLMPRRNEAAVLFEQRLDAGPALERVRRWNEERPAGPRLSFFHLVVRALARVLEERPRVNRFLAGGRHYQRRGVWITYSAKKALDDEAPIVVLKREFDPRESLAEMVAAMVARLEDGRSARRSAIDREVDLLLRLPGPVLGPLVRAVRGLDAVNLLPEAYIRSDPFYASAFVANLGSLKLDAAFHHAYEYGNIPVFVTIGRVADAVVAGPAGVTTRREVTLRWTFDERVEDGLYCARGLELLRERLECPETLG